MENVFEPMNFAGDVFEPLNFDGDYSNFAVLNCGCNVKHPFNKGKRTECINKCNQKKAEKKDNPNANVKDTLSTPTPPPAPASPSAPAPAPKEDTSLATTPDNNTPQEKFLGMPKKVGIGVLVGVGVLALGLTTFFLLRKK